jgi:hypothetical protein
MTDLVINYNKMEGQDSQGYPVENKINVLREKKNMVVQFPITERPRENCPIRKKQNHGD